MDLLIIIFFLLIALMVSNIIGHYIPSIPTALIQIALGVILAIFAPELNLELETEWFLLLFVAPLLYNDGRNFPRENLWNMRIPILGNAIVLVLITTIGGGFFIHWLVPAIPLAPAFALAAILSPTDPVAVNGIAKRIQIPDKILSVVRGESLINDASGLVAFKYAVAAAVSGYFSIQQALVNFTYTFIIGAIIGLILGFVLTEIRFMVRRAGIRDAVFHTLFQILMPFIIYLIAEDVFHASGVIAVVIGGIIQSLFKDRTETTLAEEQVLTENVWAIILFVLNGVVFLLLGLNIPSSMENSLEDTEMNNWTMIAYAAAIGIVILGIRFLWSHLFSVIQYRRGKEKEQPLFKMSLISSLVGVRGAVTMAGILSLPLVLENGDPFPERSLILFLASGVILFTLLVATIFLPMLTDDEEIEELLEGQLSFHEAKSYILVEAVKRIQNSINDENRSVAYDVIDNIQQLFRQTQLEANADDSTSPLYANKILKIRLDALRVEKQYVNQLYKENKLDDMMYMSISNSFKDREEMLHTSTWKQALYTIRKVYREARLARKHYRNDKEHFYSYMIMRQDVRRQAYNQAVTYLKEQKEKSPRKELYMIVLYEYDKALDRLRKQRKIDSAREEEIQEELNLLVLETERSAIHKLYEDGKINREQEKELRRLVNYMESISLYEHVE
ncbi:Na+/H+ antiporter [Kurthia sibirica]|uniref:Na+/H+ antiporter n=1 Tax=Kurthia sibirica TaxID=202750 RepID=A0A2U3AJ54_9BACL|nr:Na+/H+ antiporter [Kurthia sibirica]PWI24572.1 Na+/H+ antiporter [Kurthia sibirica]GEK33525.1 sodium, potassium, lithium and rubidium/H(+) antiporter [Kurthia sibirica]